MAVTRSTTAYVTANSGETAGDEIATNDDNKRRTVTGVFVGDTTKKARFQLLIAGQLWHDIDLNGFDPTRGPIAITVPVDLGIQLQPQIKNGSGGTLTDVPITLYYEY